MHNPAQELIDIFESWDKRPGAAWEQTGASSPAAWNEFQRAFQLVDEIAEVLQALSKQGHRTWKYLDQLPLWRESILHYRRDWERHRMDLRGADHLDTLAMWFETANLPDINARMPSDLKEKLDEISDAIRDSDLDPALLRHVAKLISHIRSLLEMDTAGFAFDLQESIRQLKFCMDAAAEQSQDESKTSIFRGFAHHLAAPLVTGSGAGVASGMILRAIGM